MNVGIVGLGLIGGSLAKAFCESGQVTVFGLDQDKRVEEFAAMAHAIHGPLTPQNIPSCELILIALYPQATVDFVAQNAALFHKDAVVIDCAGTKRQVCEECFPIAKAHGFTFVGGHPMAGTQFSGFKYSRANLFKGAPMVIVPPVFDDILLLQRIKDLLAPVGFGSFSVTTANEHDRVIAFTSQLAHIVSNAYIKSPTALDHKGFSAGSYRDMTRVAWLAPGMWSELFLANRDHILDELDTLIQNLAEYRDAIANGQEERLYRLLLDGKLRKEETDGK
ncbi:MAG: prephenate dehydrogenase [Clostridia bacterium]|nr:prephenate dehydrogenase [Clostridia bacterium]